MKTQFIYCENELGERFVAHTRLPIFFAEIVETPDGDDLALTTDDQQIFSKLRRGKKWLAHYYATKNIKRWVKTKES